VADVRPEPFRIPEFDTVEEHRLHLKQRLAAAFRLFGRFGFDEGAAGHITARDPEHPDRFWVNPFGMSFRQIRASDLICVDHDGNVVEGDWPLNRAAFAIHSRIHRARPEVVAAAHAHSVYGKAFSALGIPLAPITQDAAAFYEDHTLIADQGGAVVFEVEAGRQFAAAFPTTKLAIHQNHGHFSVGESVDEAAWWFITFERSAQAQLAAMAAGGPDGVKQMPAEYARYTREQTGYPLAGWFQFQPLWDDICRTDPELFD